MHLREGGRCDRLLFDDIETVLEVRAILLDHRPDIPKRDRRNPVLQHLQFHDQLGRKELPAGAHDLAELYVGRPQLLDGKPDTFVDRSLLFRGFPEPPEPLATGNDLFDEDPKTVLDQHIRDLPVALEPGDHRG